MPYVVQKREIGADFALFEAAAEALKAQADLTDADARHRIRHSHGIIALEDAGKTKAVSEAFKALDIDNFVLEELLPIPRAQPIPDFPNDYKILGLVVLGAVTKEVSGTSARGRTLTIALWPRVPIPSPTVLMERQQKLYLDMVTLKPDQRFRLEREHLDDALRNWLEGTRGQEDHLYLCASARGVLEGEREVARFPAEGDYDRYVNWMFQLRYAAPDAGSA